MNLTLAKAEPRLNKGQRTANRILDAAEELFASAGYDATSLRDIAEKAGIQQPGLYKHFASKEDLYRQVYARALEPLVGLMDRILAGPDDTPGLFELAGGMTDLLAVHPNIARLLIRAGIARDQDGDTIGAQWLKRLLAYGQRIKAKTGVEHDDDAVAVQIVAIFNMLFGFFWSAPLLELLTAKPAGTPALLDIQKGLLRNFVRSLDAKGQLRA